MTAEPEQRRAGSNLSGELLKPNTFRQRRVLSHGNLDLSHVTVEVLRTVVERSDELAQWVERHIKCTAHGLRRQPPHGLSHYWTAV